MEEKAMNKEQLGDIIIKKINELTNGDVTAYQKDMLLTEIHLDSLLFVLLLCNLETELKVDIEYSNVDFNDINTVNKLASYIIDNVLVSEKV